jgi:uncharacterized membrane protein YecN with MAPEG domain
MNAMPVPLTATVAALLALMLVGVSIRVTVLRARTKIDFADGGNQALQHAIRVQGNFIEYVPMALALMAAVEWLGAKPWIVYLLAISLLLARIIHAWGIYADAIQGRVVGTSVTWVVLAAGALLVLGLVA